MAREDERAAPVPDCAWGSCLCVVCFRGGSGGALAVRGEVLMSCILAQGAGVREGGAAAVP